MAEYIERDKVLEAILDLPPKMDEQGYGWLARGSLYQLIRDFPSADVQPMKHGKWIAYSRTDLGELQNNTIECSECGIHFPLLNMPRRSFCPNCGARMGGEKNV